MANGTVDAGREIVYARPCDVLQRLGADTLDETERARAARISDKLRHQHFTAGRALLRHHLSCVVEQTVRPAAWRMAEGLHGKPSTAPGLPQVHFSISHADGLVMVATSQTTPVGIDLERVTGTRDTNPALDQLSHREQAWLSRHDEADRWPAFLQLWTAKEAVSKAIGLGCGVNFHDIEIDVPARRARCPDGLLDVGDHLDVDLRTINSHHATYCLSAASMKTDGGTHSVC
ncbi:MAG: 4'-phosphopantetheinyl transferase superfamily protein [Anderseniella sp.]